MRRRLVVAFLAPALLLYLGFVVLPAIQASLSELFPVLRLQGAITLGRPRQL